MDLLIPREKYLEAGMHIGTKVATKGMMKNIYKIREDGLCMLKIEQIDEKIRTVSKLLSMYKPEKIVVVAYRVYAIPAAKKFAQIIGAKLYEGRFVPGTFTNPQRSDFFEPEIVVVCDPRIERQALIEATKLGIPTVALTDTDNVLRYIDCAIPCNNKGKKSIPLIFFLLTKELLKNSGKITNDEEFNYKPEDFEGEEKEKEEETETNESETEES